MLRDWLLAASAPSEGWLHGVKAWMEGFAASPAAGLWLFLFAFAESSFFPIPPDVLLIALCLTESSLESLGPPLLFAGVCTVASAVGGVFGYYIGARAGRPLLLRLARAEKVDAAERLLQKWDVWAIGAAGFTPIPYKIFTIASGMLGVGFLRFLAVSVASRGARFFLVALVCYAVGLKARQYLDDHLGWLTLAFLVLLLAGFLVLRAAGRRLAPPTTGKGRPGGGPEE